MQTSSEINYDFGEDLAGEQHIRTLLSEGTIKPKIRFRSPQELLKPYTMPQQRDEIIREDFPELPRSKSRR